VVDVILTVNGGKKICKSIENTEALIGVESGNNLPQNFQPKFVDYPFTKEELGFEYHLKKVKEFEPKYAVAPDLENSDKIDLRLRQTEQLNQYADNVIFITKIGQLHPRDVPNKFVVGFPNQPKFGSNGCWPSFAYRECDRIHILGGSPLTYPQVRFLNVVSVDSASLVKAAAFGNYYEGNSWLEDGDLSYYERIEISLNNIYEYWN